MSSKVIECNVCGQEIAKNAKSCPHCGTKNEKPFYTKWWFIVLCALSILVTLDCKILGTAENLEDTSPKIVPIHTAEAEASNEALDTEQELVIVYEAVTIDDMMNLLYSDEQAADTTYNDNYFAITGRVGTIDSNDTYITLLPIENERAFVGVTCYIQNEAQENAITKIMVGDTVTIYGVITYVGKTMGYALDIDSIVY